MAANFKEIERKFLVEGDFTKDIRKSYKISQGYLCNGQGKTVRVRVRGDEGFLTIKGPSLDGMSRFEWEKRIPVDEAEMLLTLCDDVIISKTRHLVPNTDGIHTWEVDVFEGANEGLVLAEIELSSVDEEFDKPSWLGKEVTGDRRYYNGHLSRNPYKKGTL